jgi:8-oxo-dGTP pyrophosphatase MutT (NUDIX family)
VSAGEAAAGRRRAAIVLPDGGRVALIRRERLNRVYYVFPGGGVEPDETWEEAAVREAREELGLDVGLGPLIAEVRFGSSVQRYFLARRRAGRFGSGTGAEMHGPEDPATGSYRAVWVACARLAQWDVRPAALARALATTPSRAWPRLALSLTEGS